MASKINTISEKLFDSLLKDKTVKLKKLKGNKQIKSIIVINLNNDT